MILNVKQLNTRVKYVHFKMDTLESCLNLMELCCYMANVDLTNAYLAVPIHTEDTKYLKFVIHDQLNKYLFLPQGYRDSPRIFTKLTKPIIASLHSKGVICSMYIDDLYIQGSDYEECLCNIMEASKTLTSLGFDISPKSVSRPTQVIERLGFMLNPRDMTVFLSDKKKEHVRQLINNVLANPISVRNLAQVIGTLIACLPAVQYGQLFYREMKTIKILALHNRYDYNQRVQ